jgi:hypothetical protein
MTSLRQMNAFVITETHSFVITEATSSIQLDPNRWVVLQKLHHHVVVAATPSQVFSRTDIEPNLKNWYPLFCPAYVLAQPLRAGKPYDNWRDRSAPGIYLGFSPLHARSVALVLNPLTGYVSPQFHIVFDNFLYRQR